MAGEPAFVNGVLSAASSFIDSGFAAASFIVPGITVEQSVLNNTAPQVFIDPIADFGQFAQSVAPKLQALVTSLQGLSYCNQLH